MEDQQIMKDAALLYVSHAESMVFFTSREKSIFSVSKDLYFLLISIKTDSCNSTDFIYI